MSGAPNRRRFLQTVASSAVGMELLAQLPTVSLSAAQLEPDRVRLRAEIEPLVRLIEDTDRSKLLESVAAKIRAGTSYREILAALLLAGVRNVQPRPSVGFKFHAVLVVHSAHLASMASADQHRWLPIFWALDEFKSSQARDVREGNWTMSAADESAVPPPGKSAKAFTTAMDRWDVSAADAAVVGLARGAGRHEVFELFCRYAARDYRSIGHKAIFLANSWRTLQCIGWRHAEPILRSLTYALLNHNGEPNPATSDLAADRPWRHNKPLAAKLKPTWRDGKLDGAATRDLLDTLRESNSAAASEKVVELLNRGVAPQSVWDSIFLGGGELLARQSGIVSLHALTTANAMYYLAHTARDEQLRRQLLLQSAAFVTLFRDSARGRGPLGKARIMDFAKAEIDPQKIDLAAQRQTALARISKEPQAAVTDVMTYLHSGGDARELISAARLMIFFKGTNSHDYKFSSAVMEDFYHVSPDLRDRFLAASTYKLRGSGGRDNPIVKRTRAALA